MAPRLPKFSNVAPAEAKEALDGYILVKGPEVKEIQTGDNIKYSVENVLKGGGIVRTNKFPDYIAVRNKYKAISWCVQLNEPTLQIWRKTQEMEEKEKGEKKKLWELYKAGKIMQINKETEEMKKIYEMYKSGQLIMKK